MDKSQAMNAISLGEVIISDELMRRASRAPDHAAENRALQEISEELAKPAGNVLKKLTDKALELCGAHTAGISLLEMEEGRKIFRWHAISGRWARYEGGSLPRDSSPCGIVLDHNAVQLMANPERFFASMSDVEPKITEVLLIPFCVLGEPVGTIWIISHEDGRRFDPEDYRLMGSLANLAAAAYVLRSSLQAAMSTQEELVRANERLRRSNERLWERLTVRDPAAG